MMKKLLALCLAFVMIFCQISITVSAAPAEGWTLLVYLCGSDLESDGGCATGDLIEMLESEYNENVRIVVQTGGAYAWDNETVDPDAIERYVRTSKDLLSYIESLPDANMGEADTLADFLEWGIENYSSEHMGLIFWNHDGGSISGVCFDEKYDYDSLTLKELDAALSHVQPLMSVPFEFIGFDACLMSTLETASVLSPYAKYMYASEETEPGSGWDYTALLNYLADNPDADGVQLGEVQCETYYAACMDEGYDPTLTFSITDLSRVDDVIAALDQTFKEVMEANAFADIARGIIKADNFGGNNRTEGYTNMVDLMDILSKAEEYAPSAKNAMKVLESAVVCHENASMHRYAGGLSIYYPLKVQGSRELSVFSEVCPSTYYYALAAQIAGGADDSVSSVPGHAAIDESGTVEILDVYLDEGGNYTVELADMDLFAFASCSLCMEDEDGNIIYLGEDDEVITDYDNCMLQDNFDGLWLCFEDYLLPIELVWQNETVSVYVCDILLNGEETNMQILYDWEEEEYIILGAWDGVDGDTGMAARSADPFLDGDVINIVFWYEDEDGEYDYILSDDILYEEGMNVYYDQLPEADYYYSINVYDIYGNGYDLDYTIFHVDEDGSVSFYTD